MPIVKRARVETPLPEVATAFVKAIDVLRVSGQTRDSRLLNAPEGERGASLRQTVSALRKGWTNAAGFGIIRGESGFLSRLFWDK
jgi:hypothetical protein